MRRDDPKSRRGGLQSYRSISSLPRFTGALWCACIAVTLWSSIGIAQAQNTEKAGHDSYAGRLFTEDEGTPFFAAVSITADSVSNLSGGIRKGTAFASLVQVIGAMYGKVIGLPSHSRFNLSLIRTDSQLPSVKYIGDSQVASNISANTATRIYQLWYRQDLPSVPVRLRVGVIDLNLHFDVTESAGTLINSSFGFTPVITVNAPAVSTYPKPGYGAMLLWAHGDTAARVGVFQGNALDRGSVFHDGQTIIGEWQHLGVTPRNRPYTLKLGAWQCDCAGGSPGAARLNTWGGYGSVQMSLGTRAGAPVSVFGHLAVSPSQDSLVPAAVALGFNVPAPFISRAKDLLSVGLTRENLRHLPAETSYEVTYVAALAEHFSLQPDMQYIVHPSGVYPNAWVFMLRVSYSYDDFF